MVTVNDLKGKMVAAAVSGGLNSCTVTRWLMDNLGYSQKDNK